MNVQKINYTSANAPQCFAQSLKETGFAVITHHPISFDLVKSVYEDWKIYFSSEAKHQDLYDKEIHAGYFPFLAETAKGFNKADIKRVLSLLSLGQEAVDTNLSYATVI